MKDNKVINYVVCCPQNWKHVFDFFDIMISFRLDGKCTFAQNPPPSRECNLNKKHVFSSSSSSIPFPLPSGGKQHKGQGVNKKRSHLHLFNFVWIGSLFSLIGDFISTKLHWINKL